MSRYRIRLLCGLGSRRVLSAPLSTPSVQFADRIRNVGIVAHIDAGKTTTTETMLYMCGEIKQLGRVDTGDTYMDFLPLERERGITISSATTQMNWKNNIINVIDTPGHVDFTFEVARSARVLDGCVVIIDAVAGVQAQTRTVWKQTVARKHNGLENGLPAVAFVNKMDRSGADFDRSLASMRQKLNANIVPIQYPVGSEETFTGVVDLIGMNKLVWPEQSSSRSPAAPAVTALLPDDELYPEAVKRRADMLAALAENDEVFLDKYLMEEERVSDAGEEGESLISMGDVLGALTRLCSDGVVVPTLCGASLRGKGVEPLLDAIGAFLPAPGYAPIVNGVQAAPVASQRFALVHKEDPSKRRSLMPVADGPMCALVFKLVHDPNRGIMAFVRVFSGTLSAKSMIHNTTKGVRERVHQLCRIQADDLTMLDCITAGDVGCIIGLKNTVTGDTIMQVSDDKTKTKGGKGRSDAERLPLTEFVLDGMAVPDPVYSVSVEPDKSSEQPALEKALHILALEDPSLRVDINEESGTIMLHGLGELHLEIVLDKLKRTYNLEVTTGKAYVGYRETIAVPETLEEVSVYDKTLGVRRLFSTIRFRLAASDEDVRAQTNAPKWRISDTCRASLGSVCPGASASDVLNSITDAFENSYKNGPQGFPITGVSIEILNIEPNPDCSPGAIRAGIASFIDGKFRDSAYYTKLEPIMEMEVEVPQQFVGDVLNDLCLKRRAVMREVVTVGGDDGSRQRGSSALTMQMVHGEVPLETMLGYATVIRSMTQGEGSFSMEYKHHAPAMQ